MSSCGQIVGSILTGFGRGIQVIGLIVLTLMSIGMLKISHLPSDHTRLLIDQIYNQPYKSLVETILWINILVNGFGLLMALFKHRPSMKAYSGVASFAAVAVIIYALCATMGFFSGARDNYINKLANYQTLYDWQRVPPESVDLKRREATLAWDDLQDEWICCGINGPTEWDKFRPTGIPPAAYPRSCCPYPLDQPNGAKYCLNGNEVYKLGCLKIPTDVWMSTTAWIAVLAIIQLVLALLSLFMAQIGDDSPQAPHLSSMSRQNIALDFSRQ